MTFLEYKIFPYFYPIRLYKNILVAMSKSSHLGSFSPTGPVRSQRNLQKAISQERLDVDI